MAPRIHPVGEPVWTEARARAAEGRGLKRLALVLALAGAATVFIAGPEAPVLALAGQGGCGGLAIGLLLRHRMLRRRARIWLREDLWAWCGAGRRLEIHFTRAPFSIEPRRRTARWRMRKLWHTAGGVFALLHGHGQIPANQGLILSIRSPLAVPAVMEAHGFRRVFERAGPLSRLAHRADMAARRWIARLGGRIYGLHHNGKLVYGISGGDEHSVFCLDMESGVLKIIGHLDRERESEYLLNVSVYDLGKPQKSVSRVLPITVLDVNDNAPKFEKTLASFRVTENALNGTVIFRANATDADTGDNGKVTYGLVTDTKDFAVNRVTGVLTVANFLDRERQEVYELKIRASDGAGKPSDNAALFSEALVRVLVDDVNDNAPKFSLAAYSVKVREDIPKGSVVAVVSASDPDLGADGEVVYALEDGDSDGKSMKLYISN